MTREKAKSIAYLVSGLFAFLIMLGVALVEPGIWRWMPLWAKIVLFLIVWVSAEAVWEKEVIHDKRFRDAWKDKDKNKR